MATLAGNGAYLSVDGTDVSAYSIVFEPEQSAVSHDITAGFGATYVERAPGLKDFKGKFTLVYDTTLITTHIQKVAAGDAATTWIWCPEGNTGGKPKHEQSCIITNVSGPRVHVDKSLTVLEVSVEGAAAPAGDMYAGNTV